MKKLNKKHREKVEIARKTIRNLQEAESIIYNSLINELEVDNDWLYDYVFNCVDESDYTTMVRNEIFK